MRAHTLLEYCVLPTQTALQFTSHVVVPHHASAELTHVRQSDGAWSVHSSAVEEASTVLWMAEAPGGLGGGGEGDGGGGLLDENHDCSSRRSSAPARMRQ